MSAKSLQLCLTPCDPMNCSPQAPLPMGFSRQEGGSGLPFPSPGDLPDPGIEPMSVTFPALAGRFFTTSATWEGFVYTYPLFFGFPSHLGHSQFPLVILYIVVVCTCQSRFPNPSHPLGVHTFVLYICVSISALQRSSSLPFS